MKIKKLLVASLPAIFILLGSFWAIEDLLKPGFFPMHDDTQVVRVYEMTEALRSSQFPVRWVPDLGYGYGYAIFNFYSPLPYYVGGFFNLLGLDALAATKMMFIIGILFSGVSMYFLAKEFWGRWGGVLSALLYVYAPYHLLDVYVRGAVGEFWAIAFLPLMFYGVFKLYLSDLSNLRNLFLPVLSLAAVILSHNITALLLALFLAIGFGILLITSTNKKEFILHYSCFIILGLMLSAFFWLPAIIESGLTKVATLTQGTNAFRLHFVCLRQLWDSSWGFGGSVPGCTDGLSFQIGQFHILYALLGLIAMAYVFKKSKMQLFTPALSLSNGLRFALLTLFLLLLSIFMMLSISSFIWDSIPPLAFVQYPWRLLSFTILFVSFFAGAIFLSLKNKPQIIKIIIVIILISLPLIKDYRFTKPRFISPWTEENYINEENVKWRTSKISDEYLPKDFPVPENKEEICWDEKSCDPERKIFAQNLTKQTPVRTLGNLISLAALALLIHLVVKFYKPTKPF